jgi:hypothetical protein
MLFSRTGGGGSQNDPWVQASVVATPLRRYFLISSMKPKCDLCGTRHESYQAHVFATNRIATNTSATNRKETRGHRVLVDVQPDAGARGAEVVVDAVGGGPQKLGSRSAKSSNRRSRESYNAYQREYMRKRRGK